MNHGVEEAAVQQIKDSVAQFFSLPLEAKNTVAVREGDGFEGFGHHFSGRASTDKLDWAECLLLFTRPVQIRNMDSFWPTNPPTFRCVCVSTASIIRLTLTMLLN